MLKLQKHIVWFTDTGGLDLKSDTDRKWWIKQVLLKGRMEDVATLDYNEIESALPTLYLPKSIKKLWEDYFEWTRKGTIDGTPANPIGDS